MVRRLKSSAAALDKHQPPEQFVRRNRRIVLSDAVAACDQTRPARNRGHLHDAVCDEPVVSDIEHDLPYGDFRKVYVLNQEEVTGLDRGHHACTGDEHVRISKSAHCFRNEIASDSVQVFYGLLVMNEQETDYDAFRLCAQDS